MNLRPALAATTVLAALALAPGRAQAAVCNQAACTSEILGAAGLVVNEVFKDSLGHDAYSLPVYGKLINNWPGCPERVDFAGAGHSIEPYNCPGQYVGDATTPTVANANTFLSFVDRYWWQPCRLANPTLVDIGGGTMCVQDWSCIADGLGDNYNPWQGMVFDLGGPSNKVAIFAENDHVPQPCESLEYTVFLSDNPYALAQVLDPKTEGVDPMKWNRAVLSKIYTKGFVEIRPPDPNNPTYAACGDVPEYSVEEDSFVQVFSLPCGITFRYAAIVAGNDGRDFPSCRYDSNEGEIDAVAGLTESGTAVCPDADNDHYVDCNCPGAPPVCDCNDADPSVHPGAPEACDSQVDLNCDNAAGSACAGDTVCYESQCITPCGGGENPYCAPGTTCKTTPSGNLCVPDNCNCGPGQVCIDNQCVDACQNVVCPGTQVCLDGQCFDPCANIECPQGQFCQAGQCVFPCGCFAGDIGCNGGLVCDTGNSNTCVPPACKGVTCPMGQTCDAASGQCVSFCNNDVHCPAGQKCIEPTGCVPLCQGVSCPKDFACDPQTGECVDTSCENVTCFPPQTCVGGVCVTPDGGATGGGGQGGTGGEGGGSMTTSSSGSSGGGANPGDPAKCGCRIPGEPDADPLPGAGALALLGIAAAIARRRR